METPGHSGAMRSIEPGIHERQSMLPDRFWARRFAMPRNDAEAHAGTGAARATDTGRNVSAMRKAPIPMIQEPI